MHDAVDKLPRYETRVVPFAVVADPEIEDIDILVTVARVHVKKEKGIKDDKQHHQQPDGVHQRFGLEHHNKRRQPGGIHGDKQARMFADKANAKARAIIALFADVKIVDGGDEQALYLGHFLPS